MYSHRSAITESELAYHTEVFRLSSLGCEGYTTGVCAALLCIVSDYTGKAPNEIGGLTGEQLWALARAGFMATIKIPDLPKPVNDYLCVGERFAINLGLCTVNETLPIGGCFGEIFESSGVSVDNLVAVHRGDIQQSVI